jgi:hypothetical protein
LSLDDACCYGHHLSDKMLSYDAATGQTVYVGPTNEEVLHSYLFFSFLSVFLQLLACCIGCLCVGGCLAAHPDPLGFSPTFNVHL